MFGVLFDLDGTLHDRRLGLFAFASDQFSRLGVYPAQLSQYVTRFIELDANGRVWKDEVYSQLIKEFELKGNPAIETLVAEYLTLYPHFSVEVAEATLVIKALKEQEILVGIVTNGRSDLQRAVIRSLGFETIVHTIVISEEAGFRKPQREIFEIALKQLGTLASETFFIGDDPYADIEGALMAGMQPIAFNCPRSPDGVISINTLSELGHAISTER